MNERWARFWSVDLHVHSPASADAKEEDFGTPEDLVSAALGAGLDAIAITDHNTADWCDAVAEAAARSTLVVLPGVEISTPEGHLLGIWEAGTGGSTIEDLLITVGIPRASFGRPEATATKGFEACAQEIVAAGGIAVPAHVDKERGLLGLPVRNHANALLKNQTFAAFEFVKDDTPQTIENRIGGGAVRPALIQGSDAYDAALSRHAASGIGVRRTWVKAARPDLVGIKHALADPELRISLDAIISSSSGHPQITSIQISNGFLGGLDLALSPDLNCLLGGTGSGKSLTLEALRFAFAQQVDARAFPSIRAEVDGRLRAALGTGCEVVVGFETGEKGYRVRRKYSPDGVEPPIVEQEVGDAWVEVDQDLRTLFPLSAFSQGEVLEYAREPVGRMVLIDSHLDLSGLQGKISELKSDLRSNGQTLISAWKREQELLDVEATREQLEERIAQLSELFEADMVDRQSAWTADRAAIDNLVARLPAAWAKRANKLNLPEPQVSDSNAARFAELRKALEQFSDLENGAITTRNEALEALRARVNSANSEVRADFQAFTRDLDELLREKGGSTVPLLRTELETAQSKLTAAQAAKKELDEQLRPLLLAAREDREALLNELADARRRIRSARRDRVDALNRKTAGHVQLDVPSRGDSTLYRNQLDQLKVGSRVREPVLDAIAANVHPRILGRAIADGDATIGGNLPIGVSSADVARLIANVRERDLWEVLFELDVVDQPDVLRMKFRKPEGGAYVSIEDLSHGQKCTAVLVVLLADGNSPVLVDQPEDALHAPWIEDYLVERLRKLRGSRQYIFATRSPGLVVSADAEQLVTMKASATTGVIEASGSLERHDLNALALYHLEGGRPPFERRASKLATSM